MKRRTFIERILPGFALAGLFLGVGCTRKEEIRPGFGNQESLWQLAVGGEKAVVPLDMAHAKDTPALYRDASMAKAGAALAPKVEGG